MRKKEMRLEKKEDKSNNKVNYFLYFFGFFIVFQSFILSEIYDYRASLSASYMKTKQENKMKELRYEKQFFVEKNESLKIDEKVSFVEKNNFEKILKLHHYISKELKNISDLLFYSITLSVLFFLQVNFVNLYYRLLVFGFVSYLLLFKGFFTAY